MRKFLATILVVGLVFATLGGLPALGDDGEPSQAIGRYERITGNGDLTDNHVAQTGSGLQIEGPSFTNTLRVDTDFLELELGGGWSASAAFSLDGDHVVFEGRKADFSPLEIGADPVFTMGSRDQIEFQERPMWVSVDQAAHGETLVLDMDDGDKTGQPVYIAKEWLWGRGIHRPVAVHEDGTNLTAVATEGRDGWMIDMHHFTYVEITAADQLVYSRQDGIIVPHTDETRWYEDEKRLEIDVGYQCASHVIVAEMDCTSIDQDVLVDKDWLDMNIEDLALEDHVWEVNSYNLRGFGQEEYYEVALTAGHLPTTVIYKFFDDIELGLYTSGSEDILYVQSDATNVSFGIVGWEPSSRLMELAGFVNASVFLSNDWLTELGIEEPLITAADNRSIVLPIELFNGMHTFSVPMIEGVPEACDGGLAPMIGNPISDGGNTYAFYRNPVDNNLYISYMLKTNTMSMGANEYGLSVNIWNHGGSSQGGEYQPDEGDWSPEGFGFNGKSIECAELGQKPEIGFWITGGAVGWSGGASVSVTVWAEFGVEAGWSATGPEASASASWGASIEVTGSLEWDQEVLIDARGSRNCAGIIEGILCLGSGIIIEELEDVVT